MAFFDFLTGGGQAPTPGLLDAAGYMDPAQYDAQRRAASMSGLWAGLLQGGGPSLEPRNFGSALGAGLLGQNQFGSQFDEAQQHRATAQAKLAEIDMKKKGFQLAQDWIGQKDGVATPSDAAGTGTGPGAGASSGGGGGGGGGGWGPHAATAIDALKGAGYSDAAIQGIMANGLGEGGFKDNWQKAWGNENSFGHWQFYEKGELPGYLAFVKEQGGDPKDTRLQALYVAKRAEEVSPGFSKLTDPKAATDIFATKFERYKGAAPGQRYGLLADAQRYITGTPVEERQPLPAGPGGYTGPQTTPRGEPVPMGIPHVPNYAGAFGGPGAPAPAVVADGSAPAPAVLSQKDQYTADVAAGRRPAFPPGTKFNSRGFAISPDLSATLPGQQSGANIPPNVRIPGAPPADAPIKIEPLSGEAVPAGEAPAGPQFGSGVFSPAAQAAAAAGAPAGAPPVPAAMVAPAPAVPPPPAAAAAAAAAMPPAPAVPGAAPGAAPAPGAMTVTLPAPPALPTIPGAAPGGAMPQPQALPAAPEMPGIPARPVIPGAGAGAAPAVSPQVAAQARRAQGVVLGLTMMGVHVPDFLQKEAGIAIAGRTAAAEAEAKQPIELQNKMFEASLTAAQKRWDAMTDQQKETLAFQRGLTKDQMNAMYTNIHEQYKSILDLTTAGPKAQAIAEGQLPSQFRQKTQATDEEVRKERETPRQITEVDSQGRKYTRWASPEQLDAEQAARAAPAPSVVTPGAPVPSAAPPGTPVPGAAPIPRGVLTDPGERLGAVQRGLGEQQIKQVAEIKDQGRAALRAKTDTDFLLNAPKIDMQGPLAASKQAFNRLTQSVLGVNSEHVQTYEQAEYLMGQQIRTALRASDPNPTSRQQDMLMATFPTPQTSEAGYKAELRYMQGIQDWQINRHNRLEQHLNNTKGDPQGFDDSISAIPFVFLRMSEPDKDAYLARVARADPATARQLVEQANMISRGGR